MIFQMKLSYRLTTIGITIGAIKANNDVHCLQTDMNFALLENGGNKKKITYLGLDQWRTHMLQGGMFPLVSASSS